ncbi:IMP 5'-nucleotidase [Ptychographa xylographoides]|nr:IMP 5'-nucleotidase [Ptychographa xylographoides]
MAPTAHLRYAEIMRDVEELINDHIVHQKKGTQGHSKLKLLVPSVGVFFTPILLEKAFYFQDEERRISSRRFVAPSFNDIRLILNTAQIMGVVAQGGRPDLITFDGDVTLYNDGDSLTSDNPVIPRLLRLLAQGTKVAIITAAGYTDAEKYYGRLFGLLEAIKTAIDKHELDNPTLLVMGGESNYLFAFDISAKHLLRWIPRKIWILNEMKTWTEANIQALLDVAETALRECVKNLRLSADILRKERAVGIIPSSGSNTRRFTREQLEETVLVTQQIVEISNVGKILPFCAFNGGNDVFVDIGDKSWGVLACQSYLGGIQGSKTIHVGDQFLSAGANDFKARSACTTAWIANPSETVRLLDELALHSAETSLEEYRRFSLPALPGNWRFRTQEGTIQAP